MARKPIAPFVVLAVLIGLAFAGSRAQTYELNEHIQCSYELARKKAPAADVLFAGNSRTGSAIDPLYIEQRLAHDTGGKLSVDRLTLALPDVPPMRVLTREYLRERGFPKVAVVQLLVNYDATMQPLVGKPIHPLRSIAFGRLDDLVIVQRETEFEDSGRVIPRWLEQGHLSLPAVALAKMTTNIYAALRYPARVMGHTVVDCSGPMTYRQNENWRYGDISDSANYGEEVGTPQQMAAWRRLSLRHYMTYDPTDPARAFENDQMHRLIALFRQGGSKVYLTVYPQFSIKTSLAERAAIQREFPEAGFIDSCVMLDVAGGPDNATHYRDEHHVNRAGALVISRGMADRLARDFQ